MMRTFSAVYSKDGQITDQYTVTNLEMLASMYGSVCQFMTDGDTLIYKTGYEQLTITAHEDANRDVD